jgi:predicted TPR repeat methyltransferase
MSFRKTNTESYNNIANQWAALRHGSWIPKPILEWENSLVRQSKVLDIGCGTGEPIARFLSDKDHVIEGIDISSAMIDLAIENDIPSADFRVCDVMDYESLCRFDGILAWDSLFHLDIDDQNIVFEKISNWLEIGGHFLFSHGNESGSKQGEMMGYDFHYSAIDTSELMKIMESVGFVIIKKWEPYVERDNDRALVVLAKKV